MKPSDNTLWERVSVRLAEWCKHAELFKYGQKASLKWISKHIPENGIIIADEVGLGKTRLALLTMIAVLEEGGTVVAVVPPGLLYQWSQEAQDVMLALDKIYGEQIQKWKPITLRTYDELFNVIGEKDRYPLANNKEQRWVLVSQTFDLYRIRSSARCWRIELPALVKAHWAVRENAHGKDKWLQYRLQRQRSIEGANYQINSWWYMENKAAEFLSKGKYIQEFHSIWDDERIRPNSDGDDNANEKCALFFQNNQLGRKLLMHLVGRLIGSIDLLVMDEAHKSRDDDENPQKRLGRLLGEILVTSKQCRRLSMTATPIELGPEQWFSLLQRTGITDKHPGWANIEKAIPRFSFDLNQASTRPDQLDVLDHLIKSASQFEKALAPFVTRRRRLHQEEMRYLLPANPQGTHPHRELKPHPIPIEGLPDDWRKMVLALEGQGLASKGLASLSHAQRQADIRYSSGLQCEFDLEEPKQKVAEEHSRKDLRVRAWAKLQRSLSDSMSGKGESWLWNHPRILQAADRIEELCALDGLTPREKVLVFGRFTEPMKALRDTLNLRHTLRILDTGKIGMVSFDITQLKHLDYLYRQQHQQKTFSGNLKGKLISRKQLLEKVEKARGRYEKVRDSLRDRFHDEMDNWIENQPGDTALRRLKSESIVTYKAVFDVLRADIFDDLLYHSKDLKSLSDAEIHQLAHKAWVSHLRCILHDSDEDEESGAEQSEDVGKRTEYKGDDKQLAHLDSRADSIKSERFKEYLGREPRSHFCRMLDGSVQHATRRSVQASFNRHEAGPYVLIAQSTVGREGLNLHKACRRVFLFHPEWNPGVMEQQIGRVDRIESLWNRLAEEWKLNGNPESIYPKIEVESLVFRGTYDEYQAKILHKRRDSLNAQLFGALLDEETMEKAPEEYRKKLADAAPNWEP
jgi:superfamily II DNA or RNA helicase